MSSQKGNSQRSRGQKHQNAKAFKNNLHDTNKRSIAVNSLSVEGCCSKCTEVIQWKIKYKKYKTLTVPKKCVRCEQKAVKRAYCVVCHPCVIKLNICAKCAEEKEIVVVGGLSEEEKAKQMSQLEQQLKLLPERKRRTFIRLQEAGKLASDACEPSGGVGRGDADDSGALKPSGGTGRGDAGDSDDPVDLSDSDYAYSEDDDGQCADSCAVPRGDGIHDDATASVTDSTEKRDETWSQHSENLDMVKTNDVTDVCNSDSEIAEIEGATAKLCT